MKDFRIRDIDVAKNSDSKSASATSQSKDKKVMTGAAILWECLEREGVKVVFGYPGGAILPAYDALKHSKIHHISGAA